MQLYEVLQDGTAVLTFAPEYRVFLLMRVKEMDAVKSEFESHIASALPAESGYTFEVLHNGFKVTCVSEAQAQALEAEIKSHAADLARTNHETNPELKAEIVERILNA